MVDWKKTAIVGIRWWGQFNENQYQLSQWTPLSELRDGHHGGFVRHKVAPPKGSACARDPYGRRERKNIPFERSLSEGKSHPEGLAGQAFDILK